MEKAMSTTTRQSIEKELNELWKSDEERPEAKIGWWQRNYTTNLVVYAPSFEQCREAETVLRELTPLHPGRYIMLCPAPEGEPLALHHHVSGHCTYSPAQKKQICCDIINLEAKPGVLEDLYGLTLSLLVSDLPVEFWWLGDLPGASVFFRLIADDSDRVWVDSSEFSHPARDLARLAAGWQHSFPNTVLADLNWIRFQRWRNLIAELFDGEWSPFLREIEEVTIEYGAGGQPTRSFLLVCWMASCLGWKYPGRPLRDFPEAIAFESGGREVTVVFKTVPTADLQRDRLYAIRIRTGNNHQGQFTIERNQDPRCVSACSEIDCRPAFARILYFEHMEPLHLLREGLRRWGKDPGWLGTLAQYRTIMQPPEQEPESLFAEAAGEGMVSSDR